MPEIDRSEPYAGLMHLPIAHGDTIHLAGIVDDDLGATIYVTDMADEPVTNRLECMAEGGEGAGQGCHHERRPRPRGEDAALCSWAGATSLQRTSVVGVRGPPVPHGTVAA